MSAASRSGQPSSQAGTRPELAALDLLGTAVLLLDAGGAILHANAAAENLLGCSGRMLSGQMAASLFEDGESLTASLIEGRQHLFGEKSQPLALARVGASTLQLNAVLVVLHNQPWAFVLELREIEHRLRIERANEQWEQADAQREVLRNLAHEVKNPLGGLRGAAQLLQDELASPELVEYTQVIIAEADRLHALVDRILAPHRMPRLIQSINIHEVCERVRALVQAEYGPGLSVQRDYDISVPELEGDRAHLIQVVLNIVRNAAQALSRMKPSPEEGACITMRTRISRQATLGRHRHPLALALTIVDNGPGIPEAIRERIFHPLVSGREGGTGLGLSLVQTFVQQHGGVVTVNSRPGHTEFQLLLPFNQPAAHRSL